ncbi:hypothetical protein FA95DRAFT_1609560 [Auriscalpium vulgare]|uniref:Uncharacterized protein n=1 Tax=Auriscalpium vulgare TaxID=40419 RepID=A0ACB8RGU1_9AGAM|nr:hypothetical protein FA95DRAFT_1609560 [Auriscalpium vulgare]
MVRSARSSKTKPPAAVAPEQLTPGQKAAATRRANKEAKKRAAAAAAAAAAQASDTLVTTEAQASPLATSASSASSNSGALKRTAAGDLEKEDPKKKKTTGKDKVPRLVLDVGQATLMDTAQPAEYDPEEASDTENPTTTLSEAEEGLEEQDDEEELRELKKRHPTKFQEQIQHEAEQSVPNTVPNANNVVSEAHAQEPQDAAAVANIAEAVTEAASLEYDAHVSDAGGPLAAGIINAGLGPLPFAAWTNLMPAENVRIKLSDQHPLVQAVIRGAFGRLHVALLSTTGAFPNTPERAQTIRNCLIAAASAHLDYFEVRNRLQNDAGYATVVVE